MPEEWVHLDTSGIREPVHLLSQGPLNGGKGQGLPGQAGVPGRAGQPDAHGVGQGPTGFSQ